MESKREKIYDIIRCACDDMIDKWDSHLAQEAGIYGYADQMEELIDSEADQQNATLIEQNKKLRELVNQAIEFYEHGGINIPEPWIDKAFSTLKDTE